MAVDRPKVEVIEILCPPIFLKCVRNYLGHAGFYQRFIIDFLKIAHSFCKLLEKECKFHFNESCLKDFFELKEKLLKLMILSVMSTY